MDKKQKYLKPSLDVICPNCGEEDIILRIPPYFKNRYKCDLCGCEYER